MNDWPENKRIVRNKAAEKAKRVHHQQEQQQQQHQIESVSPLIHNIKYSRANQQQHTRTPQLITIGADRTTNNNTPTTINLNASTALRNSTSTTPTPTPTTPISDDTSQLPQQQQSSSGYSINGILGLPNTDPNGNNIIPVKRKTVDVENINQRQQSQNAQQNLRLIPTSEYGTLYWS